MITVRVIESCAFVLAVIVSSEISFAQPISIGGGNKTINITTGIPGGEPLPATITSSTLRYRRQTLPSKITVSTSCPGQSFGLQVVAVSVPDGVAAPAVDLVNGMAAVDLITSIPAKPPTTQRSCTLQYTATATFSQGNSTELGNDVHTITYTILAQ